MKETDENKATEMVKKILEDMKHPEYGDAIQNVLNTLRYAHQLVSHSSLFLMIE